MIKPTYKDLAVILGLTILSLVFSIIPSLNSYPLNLIPAILLLLFLPGYSLMAAFDPLFDRSGIIKKALLSIIVSLMITISLALISTYTPLKAYSYLVLVALTIIFCIIAMYRRRKFSKRLYSITREDVPAEKEEPTQIEYERIVKTEEGEAEETGEYITEEETSQLSRPERIETVTESVELEEDETQIEEDQIEDKFYEKIEETDTTRLEAPPLKETLDDKPKSEGSRSYKEIIDKIRLADREVKEEQGLVESDETKEERLAGLSKPPKKESTIPEKKPSKPEKETLTTKKELPTPKKIDRTPRRKSPYLDLILVIILTGLCALFVLEPTLNKTAVRTVLGLLLVLFLPGYSLIAALFPKKDDLDSIERLALSFGLSIAITPLIGLVLNYTPYGIRLDPILVSLSSLTVLLCIVAFIRRKRISEDNRFSVDFRGFFSGINESFQGESKTGKILSVVLIISIILAISTTAYIIIKPKEGESFTEFYILGQDGKASNYPTNLTPGQEGKVIIGIVNQENNDTKYRLVVTSNGTVQMEQTLTLKDGQKVEIPFNFTAGEAGERKMEFLLYKLPDNKNIYRSLHLWLNITGSSNETT